MVYGCLCGTTLVTSIVKDMPETSVVYFIQRSLSVNRGHVFLCPVILIIQDMAQAGVKYSVALAFPKLVQHQRFIFPP
jgi:hypothetical protein